MKRMRFGFTLAEVLITLGIIGVVASIVMPSMMTNYTYKTVGVKLSKFASQLENTTRPYVAQNTNFTNDEGSIGSFVNESFIIMNKDDFTEKTIDCSSTKDESEKAACGTSTDKNFTYYNYIGKSAIKYKQTEGVEGTKLDNSLTPVLLKDGTELQIYAVNADHISDPDFDVSQVGVPVFGVGFAPNVQGLPKAVNKVYPFIVTELGYVFPDINDDCIEKLSNEKYMTNAKSFAAGTECSAMTKK